jgi:6-phosphogluconolactonase
MAGVRDGSRWWRRVMTGVALLGSLPMLNGCDNFFTPNTSGGGSGSGSTVGGSGANYVYVVNTATSTVSGFLVGAGTLTATPSSPYALGFVPQSAVVTRANNFLYVAGQGALYAFPINTDGSLSTGTSVAIGSELSLAVSPDGQWLFGLNSIGATLDEWKINSSTGAITAMTGAAYTVTDATPIPLMMRVSPAGNYIFAALGPGGDQVFTLNTSTGSVASSQHLSVGSTNLTSDNSLVTDPTGSTLYIARSGQNSGLAVYTIGAAGLLTSVSGSPFATGLGTFDVAVDNTGKYVYAANRTDATISGFSIGTSGALTALSGSPFASGTLPTSLAAERSGVYLLAAAAGGSPDLTMYSFDATVGGKLNAVAKVASGTDPAGSTLVATTH